MKGSSLCVRNDRRDEKVSRNSGSWSGVPEAGTAQAATQIQVFDKKVERASREMKRGFKSEFSHKIGKSCAMNSGSRSAGSISRVAVTRTTRRGDDSGFKREFDPGSESTLAACLTHASRTRKRGQLRE